MEHVGLAILHLYLFEGVSVTTVILAPGACGGGVRAAVLATTSASPVAPVACSKSADFADFYRYFRVHEVPKQGLAPTLTPWMPKSNQREPKIIPTGACFPKKY